MRYVLLIAGLMQLTGTYAGTAALEMVAVKAGAFTMGCDTARANAKPAHVVRLNDFYIGKYEVTQALWQQVMGPLPQYTTNCPECAMYGVRWEDIQLFIAKLNQQTGLHYRLPTEAEWEFAAIGGYQSRGYLYCGSNKPDEVGWYAPNSGMVTHPVGLKMPNELGLYDMSGNVWEMCSDWYDANYYRHSPMDNPMQANKKIWRVMRGGSWRSETQRLEVRARNRDVYDHHINNNGFRLVHDAATYKPAQAAAPFRSWVDSMERYAVNVFLPPNHYRWTWQNASLLQALIHRYDSAPENEKALYLQYITRAMKKSKAAASGHMPNAVASGVGMAFLYRITKNEAYKKQCDKIYKEYLRSKRTKSGAVSHVPVFKELWDDTVFMLGEFLIGMYRATGNPMYMDELAKQIALHRQELQVKEWGLWAHGYDESGYGHCLFCSQIHWADKQHKQSPEIWGRGNGWVLVTLSDAIQALPENNPHRATFSAYLKEMLEHLPALQDSATGHWYQLPVHKGEEGNFIESSCTAMFAYGIQQALQLGIVKGEAYTNSIHAAYTGLRKHSIEEPGNAYLTTKNVCKATCVGNKQYYYKRGVQNGKAYGLAGFILFGHSYEKANGLRK